MLQTAGTLSQICIPQDTPMIDLLKLKLSEGIRLLGSRVGAEYTET